MVGRKIALKDVHILIHETSEYVIFMAKGNFQMWLRLRTLRLEIILDYLDGTNQMSFKVVTVNLRIEEGTDGCYIDGNEFWWRSHKPRNAGSAST